MYGRPRSGVKGCRGLVVLAGWTPSRRSSLCVLMREAVVVTHGEVLSERATYWIFVLREKPRCVTCMVTHRCDRPGQKGEPGSVSRLLKSRVLDSYGGCG